MGGPGRSFWRGAAEGTARRAPREGVLRGPREGVGAPVLRPPPEAHACLSPGPPPPGGGILGRGRVAAVWMEASAGRYRCRDTEGLCRCQQWPHRPSRREPLGAQRQTCRPWRGSGQRLPGPTSPRGPWKWHSQHLCTGECAPCPRPHLWVSGQMGSGVASLECRLISERRHAGVALSSRLLAPSSPLPLLPPCPRPERGACGNRRSEARVGTTHA